MKQPPTPYAAKSRFSRNIWLVRRVKNLSQEKVAEIAQLHRTYVGQVERGDVTPTLDAAERLAKALDMELWEVLHPQFNLDAIAEKFSPK